ncbi:hypothetical protein BGZ58_008041 [Dissophora ornata]|nr:hypothetical protein BGZ58_008041 [Dissophora ornata]
MKRSHAHFQSLPINTWPLFGSGSGSGPGSGVKLTRSPAIMRKKRHQQNSSMSILMNGSRWTDIERRAGSDVDDDGTVRRVHRRKHSNQEQDYYRFPANRRRHIPQGEESDYEQDYRHERKRERVTSPIPISTLFSVPVPWSDNMDTCASQSGYNSKSPSSGDTFRYHYPGTRALIATFKIIVDAERIVALQVWEDDEDFMLSVPDLRLRVRKKFERAEMPLPDDFELMWRAWNGESVIIKNDEELRKAMHASVNSKVTLTCIC